MPSCHSSEVRLAGGLDPGLPLGERPDVLVAVGEDQPGDDLLGEAETGDDTRSEALGDHLVDLGVQLLGVVLGELEQPLAAQPLDHLVAQPAAEQLVAQRAGLGQRLDDVEGLAQVSEVADRVEALEVGVGAVVTGDVVVAQVVAEDGDVLRAQVGLDDEDVVLEAGGDPP